MHAKRSNHLKTRLYYNESQPSCAFVTSQPCTVILLTCVREKS